MGYNWLSGNSYTNNSKHSEDKFSRELISEALICICVEMGFGLSASHLTTWLSLTLVSYSPPGGWVGVVCYYHGCLICSTWFTQHVPLSIPFYSQLLHPLGFHSPLWVYPLTGWLNGLSVGLASGDQGKITDVCIYYGTKYLCYHL